MVAAVPEIVGLVAIMAIPHVFANGIDSTLL